MSTVYITPQRVVTGHITRFTRRTTGLSGAGAPAQPEIHAWFNPQLLSFGERESVQAQFAAGITWRAISASFTLWAAGAASAGYNAISATISADPSGRLFTTTAAIDLTSDAEYPLEAGIYFGEFLVATSAGDSAAARGTVTIIAPNADRPPGEYDVGGGLG